MDIESAVYSPLLSEIGHRPTGAPMIFLSSPCARWIARLRLEKGLSELAPINIYRLWPTDETIT